MITGTPTLIFHMTWDINYMSQIRTTTNGNIDYRIKTGGAWGSWITVSKSNHTHTGFAVSNHSHTNYIATNGSNAAVNTVTDMNSFYNGITLFSSSTSNLPTASWWMVIAAGDANSCIQIAFDLWNGNSPMQRHCAAGSWSSWSWLKILDVFDTDLNNRVSFRWETGESLTIRIDDVDRINIPKNVGV